MFLVSVALLVATSCAKRTAATSDPGSQTSAASPFETAPVFDAGPESSDPILVGAGDISSCAANSNGEDTARILDGLFANGAHSDGVVFTAGDNAYPDGTLANFQQCYGPTWGRHKARTRPTPGNHEYRANSNGAYYTYFGAAAGPRDLGYYSYDLGNWHIVALNSNDSYVPTQGGYPQEQWLRADLAASKKPCTLAYFHFPRFSSGVHGNHQSMKSLWQALYDANSEVVVSGHDHHYERFAPQTPTGAADPARGIREFLVGTGGNTLYPVGDPIANSELHYSQTHGVLKFTLHADSYDWEFLPTSGNFTDRGRGTCH